MKANEKMLKKLVPEMSRLFALEGYEDYIEEHFGMAAEVLHNGGSIYDLDGMVLLSETLGFPVSYNFYHFVLSSCRNDQTLEEKKYELGRYFFEDWIQKKLSLYVTKTDLSVRLREEEGFLLGHPDQIASYIARQYADRECVEITDGLTEFSFQVYYGDSAEIGEKKIADLWEYGEGRRYFVKRLRDGMSAGFSSYYLYLLSDVYGGGEPFLGKLEVGDYSEQVRKVVYDLLVQHDEVNPVDILIVRL